jgi:hypothetical protein
MYALRRLSTALVLSISMLLLGSGLTAAHAGPPEYSPPDDCQPAEEDPCEDDDGDAADDAVKQFEERAWYYERSSETFKGFERSWQERAAEHDNAARKDYSRATKYQGEDDDRFEYFKNKGDMHKGEAERCRGKAARYHKAAYDHKQMADSLLKLKLKLRLKLHVL